MLNLSDGVLSEIAFSGEGCSVSIASASLMCQLCKGRTTNEVLGYVAACRQMLLEEELGDPPHDLGDVGALSVLRKFPVRIPCALLAWRALEECLAVPECSESEK